jgi:GT2 family glycosyltransferase
MNLETLIGNKQAGKPKVAICALTYGSYSHLAEKCLKSIVTNCNKDYYALIVGANEVDKATYRYLKKLYEEKQIDELYISPENINKCGMMRIMFRDIQSEYIWWFDDDSYIIDNNALSERLKIAESAPENTAIWGHMFYFGNETDFSYGTDVSGFVKMAPWYERKEPPSWNPGGKGEVNFEGKGTGDGRWFFITGGNWFIRAKAIKDLGWPDTRLIKRNDDVFLCEALRQKGLDMQDIGPLGVAINTEPRRGDGEDIHTMVKQMGAASDCKGCIYIPTFKDTHLLEENYSNRPELRDHLDIVVFDDNYNDKESYKVKMLCQKNQWIYKKHSRNRHGDWEEEYHDLSGYNHFIWDSMTSLAHEYDYVIKMDTDAYVINADFYKEFEGLLFNQIAIAGTPEYRPSNDVVGFWNIAMQKGYQYKQENFCMHMQGGIYGISKKALLKLREMGFLHGQHFGFAEDCYISYSCRLLGIDFYTTKATGSWFRAYRPELETIQYLKAIHPLTKEEWTGFSYSVC